MISKFYTQNRAQYPIYDETVQSRSLLEGKSTELKQFFKAVILNPKIANKNIAFLFVLSIFYALTSVGLATGYLAGGAFLSFYVDIVIL